MKWCSSQQYKCSARWKERQNFLMMFKDPEMCCLIWVCYHSAFFSIFRLASSFDHQCPDGKVHITMLPNPSHLEAVNPVAMGKARARARSLNRGDYSTQRDARAGDGILCALIHGDGAFTGQVDILCTRFYLENLGNSLGSTRFEQSSTLPTRRNRPFSHK